jgi:hypothetical protein
MSTAEPTVEPSETPAPTPAADDLSKLRDALEKERSLRKDAERRAKEGDATKADLDRLAAASKSDLDKAVDAARKEGAQAVLASANTRLVNAEARALAAETRFRNPALAVRAIDLTDITVTSDGIVDTAAITAALKTLAADEPYLIDDGGPRTPRPDPSQGSGKAPAQNGAEKGVNEAARRYGKPKN